jgi:hypothetical protein
VSNNASGLWILNCKCCGKKWLWSSVRCSPPPPPKAQKPLVYQGVLIIETSRPHETHHTWWYPLDGWSARRRDLYMTNHNTHKRQTSVPPAGFETAIAAFKRQQTQALGGAATVSTVSGVNPTFVWSNLRRNTKTHRISGCGPRFELWISQAWSNNFAHFTAKFA